MKPNKKFFNKEEVEKIIKQDKIKYIFLTVWELFNIGAVVFIQYFIRPKKTSFYVAEIFLLGTLPSLFGAAAFVAILFIYHKIYSIQIGNYHLQNSILFSFSVTFFGFLLWEVLRMVLYPFDIYDIIMTFIGSVLSIVLIICLFYKDSNL